ncbi:MAG: hypothetical protein AAGA15_02435 [Pseudomonadota bacterium]
MNELVLVPSRWNLIKGAVLCLICFLPAISLAFQVGLFGGAFNFFGFFPEHALLERLVGTLFVGAVSYVFADIVTYFIWRTPVVFANEDGVNVKGRFIPWDEYQSVDVKRASGRVSGASFVRVHGKRTVSIKDHEMSGRPEDMAKEIMEFADTVREAPLTKLDVTETKLALRRSLKEAQGSVRPGVAA